MVPNIKPDYVWIDKSLLIVPREGSDSYQRSPRQWPDRLRYSTLIPSKSIGSGSMVKHIRQHFCWALFGALTVIRRPNGDLIVMDGGHRLDAVKQMDAISAVPCLVTAIENVKAEAELFRAMNRLRTQLSIVDDHRAAVVQGDAMALKIEAMVRKAGRKIGAVAQTPKAFRDKGAIYCLSALRRAVSENEGAADASLQILSALCEGKPIDEYMFKAFFAGEQKLRVLKTPHSFAGDLREVVLRTGHDLISAEIRRERLNPERKTGPNDWAQAVARAVNKFSGITVVKLSQPGPKLGRRVGGKPVEIASQIGARNFNGADAHP